MSCYYDQLPVAFLGGIDCDLVPKLQLCLEHVIHPLNPPQKNESQVLVNKQVSVDNYNSKHQRGLKRTTEISVVYII